MPTGNCTLRPPDVREVPGAGFVKDDDRWVGGNYRNRRVPQFEWLGRKCGISMHFPQFTAWFNIPRKFNHLEENAQQPESRSGAKWLNHPIGYIVVSKEISYKKGMNNEDEPCLKLMTSS